MDDQATLDELEYALNRMMDLAELTLASPGVRWLAMQRVNDEQARITVESSWPPMWVSFLEDRLPDARTLTRSELAKLDPEFLAAWDADETRLFIAAEDWDGRVYADAVAVDKELAEALAGLLHEGPSPCRTRAQMLEDPDDPQLAGAMRAWEFGDDSIVREMREDWARRFLKGGRAGLRARIRWGDIDDPEP